MRRSLSFRSFTQPSPLPDEAVSFRKISSCSSLVVAILVLLGNVSALRAETTYWVGSVNDLQIGEGEESAERAAADRILREWDVLRSSAVADNRVRLSTGGNALLARAESVAFLTPNFPRNRDNNEPRSPDHRIAVRCVPGWSQGETEHPRDLLPAARCEGVERKHRSDQYRRPLPRTRSHLLLLPRRR